MCVTTENELVSILDEMIGAAVSMNSGAHNYDTFIRTRGMCMNKLQEYFAYTNKLSEAIQELSKLAN